VLVSSHLLAEVAQTVDDLVVIARGSLRASGPLDVVLGGARDAVTRVRSADTERLATALRDRSLAVERDGPGTLLVPGAAPELVGAVAAERGVALAELVAVSRSLEDAFFDLTEDRS
jgi:ABC-2 type transport system ATP-binding protein